MPLLQLLIWRLCVCLDQQEGLASVPSYLLMQGRLDIFMCQAQRLTWYLQRQVPRANTEGTNTASVIGCTYYVVVGIIWSIIWYVGLDPIKWMMAYILNEDGFRDRKVRACTEVCMP